MFTGFIKYTGRVISIIKKESSAEISIETGLDLSKASIGDSIAINGSCLTITKIRGNVFYADVSFETLARTTLGRLAAGYGVNLEQPLTPGDGLHGHLVLGHVDGVGVIDSIEERDKNRVIKISYPEELAPYLAIKGSIAVDGVSLTVNEVASDYFTLVIIPHTLSGTTFAAYKKGHEVNLEVDVIARYLERLFKTSLSTTANDSGKKGLTLEDLKENGYL